MLEVPIEWFEALPERFFEYMIQTYSMGVKREQQLNRSFKQLMNGVIDGQIAKKESYKFHADSIQKTTKDALDRVAKYFPNYQDETTELLLTIKESLKSLELQELEKSLTRTIAILQEKEIDQKLTLNVVKATILASSGGQVSFLNVAKNTLTYKEQIATFRKDFIEPLIFELKLQKAIKQADQEAAWALIQNTEHEIAKQWKKKNKKATTIDFAYFEQLPSCSAVAGQWGMLPYEEKMFMPLASTSLNDFRDGQMTNAPLISTLARLLLFLSPLGCSSYRKKIGREEQFVFSFLHVEGDCLETKNRNDLFLESLQRDSIFSKALVSSHEKFVKVEKERNSVTILIEWVTFSQAKKTLLEYRIVHERFMNVLSENSGHFDLNKVFPFSFREQLVHQLLRNTDSKVLIFEELRQLITENSDNYFSIKMALNLREEILREGPLVDNTTLTDRMYGRGQSIHFALFQSKKGQETSDYKAPNDKKLATISYRLLNAAKGGNREVFFETVLRLHVLTNKAISKEFTSLLDRNEVNDHQFATMSLAFIAGLMSSYERKVEKEEEKA